MAGNGNRLDDAARAAWLYYIAGNTQEEIAAKLGVSRQSAQRLVSQAMAAGLVKVRIDHPIAECLRLATDLKARYDLQFCDIVPSGLDSDSTTIGIAEAAATEIERWLTREDPIVLTIGTGRTLKAAVECLPRIDCPHHTVVSLTGNISPDGAAAYYNVVFTLASVVTAKTFPMPLPVIASSASERKMLHDQKIVRSTLAMAERADVSFLGIGELGESAPLYVDGYITHDELLALQKTGAVGEIVGWAFDADGEIIQGLTNERVASAAIPSRDTSLVIGIAKGSVKRAAIRAAVAAGLVNGLITDEATARALLA
ncbi:sugar-binding transcriptional regulator [Rhodospirillaceae bacterium KN72]|uniref:Sugar-binding transcriptional regulator n=1 Tax=Pacificispira spongiicola TaxID=2729598 RepID=A0A7Y0HHG1_9PROT|nr:sugar-binding transcriptional regulator [Pacificispira spongiicola]NMM45459.1 sugar-binding transcriptional regulator [Pacificispira spongiicola]